jgi:hypothetical protein
MMVDFDGLRSLSDADRRRALIALADGAVASDVVREIVTRRRAGRLCGSSSSLSSLVIVVGRDPAECARARDAIEAELLQAICTESAGSVGLVVAQSPQLAAVRLEAAVLDRTDLRAALLTGCSESDAGVPWADLARNRVLVASPAALAARVLSSRSGDDVLRRCACAVIFDDCFAVSPPSPEYAQLMREAVEATTVGAQLTVVGIAAAPIVGESLGEALSGIMALGQRLSVGLVRAVSTDKLPPPSLVTTERVVVAPSTLTAQIDALLREAMTRLERDAFGVGSSDWVVPFPRGTPGYSRFIKSFIVRHTPIIARHEATVRLVALRRLNRALMVNDEISPAAVLEVLCRAKPKDTDPLEEQATALLLPHIGSLLIEPQRTHAANQLTSEKLTMLSSTLDHIARSGMRSSVLLVTKTKRAMVTIGVGLAQFRGWREAKCVHASLKDATFTCGDDDRVELNVMLSSAVDAAAHQ